MYESNPRVSIPPPPPPELIPKHLTFFIFLVKFPTMRVLSLIKCPPPKGFLRGQMPGPRVEATKSGQIDFRKPERVSYTALSPIFFI